MNTLPSVLITGAGGFVCGSITVALLQAGWQVIAVDRQFDSSVENTLRSHWGNQVTFVRAECDNLPDFRVDALVHGAAITASPGDLEQTAEANLRANLDPLLAVSEWAARHQVRRSIWMSSSAVYAATAVGPVPETLPTSPVGLYAVAKQTLESLAFTLRQEYGRDVSVIRLSNIYGVAERSRATRPRVSLVGRMVKEALETGRVSVYADDPARDWTFAPDVGAAVAALLKPQTLQHVLYNVASEQVFAPVDIAKMLLDLLPNIKLDIRDGSDPNTPPLTRRGYLTNKRLQDETSFSAWTPFAAGLQQSIDAQRNEAISS
ncbi:MAG: NAD(P)-dependent oxidoreductase [Chloroflexi bacterium]|nr:NAD(P)-dependent oxidoreductase [Chloroflexota bacterium]MCC6895299.1 NAD(P)-dependent oxidoreductase [Anaerolineae bacterium]